MCISCKINNIAKSANLSNHGDREIEFGLFDGGEGGEYNVVGHVEIYQIFATQNEYFIGPILFD